MRYSIRVVLLAGILVLNSAQAETVVEPILRFIGSMDRWPRHKKKLSTEENTVGSDTSTLVQEDTESESEEPVFWTNSPPLGFEAELGLRMIRHRQQAVWGLMRAGSPSSVYAEPDDKIGRFDASLNVRSIVSPDFLIGGYAGLEALFPFSTSNYLEYLKNDEGLTREEILLKGHAGLDLIVLPLLSSIPWPLQVTLGGHYTFSDSNNLLSQGLTPYDVFGATLRVAADSSQADKWLLTGYYRYHNGKIENKEEIQHNFGVGVGLERRLLDKYCATVIEAFWDYQNRYFARISLRIDGLGAQSSSDRSLQSYLKRDIPRYVAPMGVLGDLKGKSGTTSPQSNGDHLASEDLGSISDGTTDLENLDIGKSKQQQEGLGGPRPPRMEDLSKNKRDRIKEATSLQGTAQARYLRKQMNVLFVHDSMPKKHEEFYAKANKMLRYAMGDRRVFENANLSFRIGAWMRYIDYYCDEFKINKLQDNIPRKDRWEMRSNFSHLPRALSKKEIMGWLPELMQHYYPEEVAAMEDGFEGLCALLNSDKKVRNYAALLLKKHPNITKDYENILCLCYFDKQIQELGETEGLEDLNNSIKRALKSENRAKRNEWKKENRAREEALEKENERREAKRLKKIEFKQTKFKRKGLTFDHFSDYIQACSQGYENAVMSDSTAGDDSDAPSESGVNYDSDAPSESDCDGSQSDVLEDEPQVEVPEDLESQLKALKHKMSKCAYDVTSTDDKKEEMVDELKSFLNRQCNNNGLVAEQRKRFQELNATSRMDNHLSQLLILQQNQCFTSEASNELAAIHSIMSSRRMLFNMSEEIQKADKAALSRRKHRYLLALKVAEKLYDSSDSKKDLARTILREVSTLIFSRAKHKNLLSDEVYALCTNSKGDYKTKLTLILSYYDNVFYDVVSRKEQATLNNISAKWAPKRATLGSFGPSIIGPTKEEGGSTNPITRRATPYHSEAEDSEPDVADYEGGTDTDGESVLSEGTLGASGSSGYSRYSRDDTSTVVSSKRIPTLKEIKDIPKLERTPTIAWREVKKQLSEITNNHVIKQHLDALVKQSEISQRSNREISRKDLIIALRDHPQWSNLLEKINFEEYLQAYYLHTLNCYLKDLSSDIDRVFIEKRPKDKKKRSVKNQAEKLMEKLPEKEWPDCINLASEILSSMPSHDAHSITSGISDTDSTRSGTTTTGNVFSSLFRVKSKK